MTDENKSAQLLDLAKMLDQGKINAQEYQEHKKMLIGDGEDIPDPDLSAVRAMPTPTSSAQDPAMSLAHEEAVRHYLKQTAEHTQKQTQLIESIRVWVMFLGILTIGSLLVWGLYLIVVATT